MIGLLSLTDVVRQTTSLRKKDGPEREVLQTVASICQPRSLMSNAQAMVQTRGQPSVRM